MEQPFFSACSIATSITVTNGSTVLTAGMSNKENDKEVVYLFVTARIVGWQGAPTK